MPNSSPLPRIPILALVLSWARSPPLPLTPKLRLFILLWPVMWGTCISVFNSNLGPETLHGLMGSHLPLQSHSKNELWLTCYYKDDGTSNARPRSSQQTSVGWAALNHQKNRPLSEPTSSKSLIIRSGFVWAAECLLVLLCKINIVE